MDNPLLRIFVARLDALEALWATLEDRVAVMEDVTCNYENRLEDLEAWQEQIDDNLERH